MTQEKPVTLSYTERIELGSAARLITEAKQPLGQQGQTAVLRIAEAECGQIARSVGQELFAGLQTAEADVELTGTRLVEARATLEAAQTAASQAPRHGNWVKVVLWGLFAVACFAAEFALTWTALCFVLNVQRMTVLGVLLGLAPPSGLAVLEVFFARLFEEPWQKLRHSAASGKHLAMHIAMAALLVVLAAGNGAMITHLAKAREESAKLHRILTDPNSGSAGDIDQAAIDRAILYVSVLVSVDGAVFLLLCLGEGSLLKRCARLDRTLAAARAASTQLESSQAVGTAKLAASREEAKTTVQKAELAAESYRAHCLFLLAEKAAADRDRPIDELVDRAFRLRLSA